MSDEFKITRYIENEPPKANKNLVEVVRCRECRHWRTRDDGTNCCVREYATDHWCADDFCSYGEREGE